MFDQTAVVELSRIQFGMTALFHFLFVPLTLGLTWMLVIMEAAYVKTGNVVYREMTQFWGKLLGINFAMGVVTGITLEFEFGQNWAYFSRMIGGDFGPILAIEGITAFMLEATMFGLFFFGWKKLSKTAHFCVTILLAFAASLSIVNILAANSFMQHPIAITFDAARMSLQLHSLADLYLSSLAQIRIGHVAFAGFIVGSLFVLGISSFYILKGRHLAFAKRSFAVAAGFGLVAACMVFFYGDENGLQVAKYEPEKMAAIEAQWTTQQAPASWYLIALPHQKEERNTWVVPIPWALSLIATHSLTGTVEGEKEVMEGYRSRIKKGAMAYDALMSIRHKRATPADLATFNKYQNNIGFGMLLTRYAPDPMKATPAQITQTTRDAIPQVSTCFWSFRVMLGCWGAATLLLLISFVKCIRHTIDKHRLFLWGALLAIPLPYIAAEAGWVLAEVGRQPWVVHEILPTYMGVSSINLSSIITSLSGFALFYCTLFAVELFLMFKYARLGPECD